jgi:hypothetical protein
MFITTENEIVSLMPTARWNRPDQLKGYLEEEERVALEPLLGTPLYEFLCTEYERLRDTYVDITASTVAPTRKARHDPGVAYADVTERLDAIHARQSRCHVPYVPAGEDTDEVPEADMQAIRLIRICQQVEFYRMLSHKAGLLSVSFNEGGGMNVVTADGYDGADEKAKDRLVKDAFMSAGRAVDSLLLFLEADAKGARRFTDLWQEADAFYLHKDLLFQTARVLNEYLPVKGERMAYVELVRDIRFCQNTYLKPRVGAKLLQAVVDHLNGPGTQSSPGSPDSAALDELAVLLRTALAFYVESRRVELGPKQEKLARRDSMTDAQQAMAMACQFIEDNLDALGGAAEGTPIYNAVRAREAQAEQDAAHADAARRRRCRERMEQGRKKLFTAFPATHRGPEYK